MSSGTNILENYLPTYKDETTTVVNEFANIIEEYLKNVIESFIVNNSDYYKYLIVRGLETIKHCFKMLYLYSKNLKLTIVNCKKALCYYIEFIGQIGEDSNSYLQLTSKDAALFVYKKVLFDIDLDYCKKFELTNNEDNFMKKISLNLDIYSNIVTNYIYKEAFINKKEERKKVLEYIIKKKKAFLSRFTHFESNHLNTILCFINSITKFVDKRESYIEICLLFLKKFNTKQLKKDFIEEKLFRNDINISKNNVKFINWLYN